MIFQTYFKATVSPVTTSAAADLIMDGVSKFKVPSSSSSPHMPHADALGSPLRRGRVWKLGRPPGIVSFSGEVLPMVYMMSM